MSLAPSSERSYADLVALVKVISQINRSLKLANVLETSLGEILRVVGGAWGCFLLLDPQKLAVQIANPVGLDVSLLDSLQRITLDPARIHDVADQSRQTEIMVELGEQVKSTLMAQSIQSFISIPLTARGWAIGVLLLGMDERAPLQPPGVDLLVSIGEQVGMAVENARLHAAVNESEAWHRAFIENSPDAFLEGDFNDRILYANDAACRLLELSREELGQRTMSDFVVDQDVRLADREKLFRDGFLLGHQYKFRTGTGKIKATSSSTRLVRDSQGNITSYQSIFRDVTEHEHLVTEITRRKQELEVLNKIAEILANPLEVERVLDQICEQITFITNMESVALYVTDEKQEVLNLTAYRGISENLLSGVRQLGLDDPITRSIAVDGQVIALDDVSFYPGDGFAGPRLEGYHAGICAPIKKRAKSLGALFIGSKARTQFKPSDVDLIANIAAQIGGALENVELYAQMTRRVRELEGLAQLSAALVSTLDPSTIYKLAVDWTYRLMHADICESRRLDQDTLFRESVLLRDRETFYSEPIILGELYESLVQARQPLKISDAQTQLDVPPVAREGLERASLRALLVMPLALRETVFGTLSVLYKEPHAWSPTEIELLKTIANLTASALDNAHLFQTVLSEQRKVQAIFDSGLSGLFATDVEGFIVMFNRAAERITGWMQSDVLGKKWEDIFASPAAGAPVEPLINEALIRKQTAYVSEGRFIQTRDARVIPVAKAVAPLFDEKGEVTGAVGAFWDLTREKQAEMEREHFLTMFAHQLRSPLTALLSAMQLLERRGLSKERRGEMLALVKSEGARLQKFTHQFLDMEGAFAVSGSVQYETVSLVDVIESMVRRFRASSEGHDFDIQSPQPPPLVWADQQRIEHILSNLLDNAVIYSPAGTRVTVIVELLNDETVQVAVQDQGPGISLAEQALVFERFYRAARSQQRRVYGHGLGLAIVREMVTEMGGTIWIESRENHGATFHFTLRRSQ